MKYLLLGSVGLAMFCNVASAEVCTDFDDDFNIVEYKCGTSWRNNSAKTAKNNIITDKRKSDVVGTPLYMPARRHWYSETALGMHRKKTNSFEGIFWYFNSYSTKTSAYEWNQYFEYGATDKISVGLFSVLSKDRNTYFYDGLDDYSRSVKYNALDFGLDLNYRFYDKQSWKMDFIGQYMVQDIWGHEIDSNFMDTDVTTYVWSAGLRGGYTKDRFTIAGKALFNYWNTESFNWNEEKGDEGWHSIILGLDGSLALGNHWNVLMGITCENLLDADYQGWEGVHVDVDPIWTGNFGINYNFDKTKFIGLYVKSLLGNYMVKYELAYDYGLQTERTTSDFSFGAKFGIGF